MAIDEDGLADGVEASDVGIYHYDASGNAWDAVDSTVTMIDDHPFVIADVTGFSTYGALVIDEEPPEIQVAESPDGSTVLFTYEDGRSGIHLGSVSLSVDGTDVTDDDGTSITSSGAEHRLSADPGETFSVTISVADKAGNDATATTSFTLEDDSDDGGADEDDSGDGEENNDTDGWVPDDGVADDDGAGQEPDSGESDDTAEQETDSDETDSDDGEERSDSIDQDSDDTEQGTDGTETGDEDAGQETDDSEAGDDADESAPGLGIGLALVSLFVVSLLALRRVRGASN